MAVSPLLRALLVMLAVVLPVRAQEARRPAPNIVVLMADDLGWGDVGFHGSQIKTPNIDALARRGVRLEQFYVQPVCSPTRGALLTGRYPIRLGLQVGVVRPWAEHGLPLGERTLANALGEAGYATAICGKWHLGHSSRDYLPTRRGFDRQYGLYNGAIDYFTHARDGGHDWHEDDAANHDKGYATDLIANAAIKIIGAHDRAKPLFLYVPFNAPHTPLQAPESHLAKYAHITDPGRRTYAAMVACMDDAVGNILGALDQHGFKREETLVFFCSDNGGINSLGSNGELRGQKGQLYEGGIRVPAVMSWPGMLTPGAVVDTPLHVADLYPTLLKLAGGNLEQPRPLDGRDAWPAIAHGQPSPHDLIVHNVTPWSGALRMGKWKLVHNGSIQANATKGPGTDTFELFDIAADPHERSDLAGEHADILTMLRGRLDKLREEAVPPNIPPNTQPAGFVAPKVWGESRPNIILINTDDLGYAGLGCYGQKLIQTPRIDRMAAEGIRFTDFYAANTVCVPSRCGMITGLHPGHAAIRDNFLPHVDLTRENGGGYLEKYPKELWPPTVATLGQVLKSAGYRTAQFGKLEAGIPMPAGNMTAHGWDHWLGFRGTGDAFQYYPLELWQNDRRITFDANQPEEVRRPGIVGNKGVYSEDLFVEELLRFMRGSKDAPFFIYFPTQVPHGRSPKDGDQIQVPDIGPYADRPWSHLEKLYAAMLTRFDGHVGRIIDELAKLGLDQNTIILLTSDNGAENSYYEYTDRFRATGPFRGKKRFLYEGGIRVPMIVRWPGRIQAGRTSDLPWAGWDLMATLAELAGAKVPSHTDGISVVPTLLGNPDRQQPREYLYWEYHQGKQQAVRMGRWKGVRFGGTAEPVELYDLGADPGESNNVAAAHPDIVEKLRDIMKAAREGSEHARFWPLPEHRRNDIKWDKAIYEQLEHGIR
jgi:arylsulfatase A-like enzyme